MHCSHLTLRWFALVWSVLTAGFLLFHEAVYPSKEELTGTVAA
jgi:hypothetical protein